jgi:type IV secretion system protein VirB5
MKVILLFLIGICLSKIHAAGIPVFDASTFAQAVESISQLKKQVEQQKAQYSAMTGSRNMGTIMNDPKLRQGLPGDWQTIYDKVKRGEISGINVTALKGTLSSTNVDQQRYYDTLASNKGMTMVAYDKTLDRLNNIEALMQRIDTTKDTKEAQDLMARVSAEQAMIQNEQTRLSLMMKLQEAELRMIEEKQSNDFRKKYFK